MPTGICYRTTKQVSIGSKRPMHGAPQLTSWAGRQWTFAIGRPFDTADGWLADKSFIMRSPQPLHVIPAVLQPLLTRSGGTQSALEDRRMLVKSGNFYMGRLRFHPRL